MSESPVPRVAPETLRDFVIESNRIEGIKRWPTDVEIAAHAVFLSQRTMSVGALEGFVRDVAGRPLRRASGQNVIVGAYRPPPGGPEIEDSLAGIVLGINGMDTDAYSAHVEYEMLHPFLDGNGRSGRALWAWHMRHEGLDPFLLPFLHRFYYQTLEHSRVGVSP